MGNKEQGTRKHLLYCIKLKDNDVILYQLISATIYKLYEAQQPKLQAHSLI